MGTVKQIKIKIWFKNYFYKDISDLENFDSSLLKLYKNHIGALVFTIFDILQLKKLVIVKIFTVWILYV